MKILIAEDDVVSRRLLASTLERWGHEVTAAASGLEGWALFQQAEFPMVISDWVMPDLDGLELIRRIRASKRTPLYVYAILLTAKWEKQDLVEAMEAGADDFISKPFDREELRVRLRAGERIVSLERALAAQNKALRKALSASRRERRRAREPAGQAPAGGDGGPRSDER